MDISLQKNYEQSSKTDIRLMKVIHDLKNPVIACRQTVNDKEILELEKVREIANQELEDLEDMLENLRTEFKARQLMDLKEEPRMVSTEEFIMSLKSSNTRLAKNGYNCLRLEASERFPTKLKLQRLNTKRIINNLVSNSLKHTNGGEVSVTFSIQTAEDIQMSFSEYNCVGLSKTDKLKFANTSYGNAHKIASTLNNEMQIKISVCDNGKGILAENIPYIFDDKHTDQADENWDGTGLGLAICVQLCAQMNAFIMYRSEPSAGSHFVLIIPTFTQGGPQLATQIRVVTQDLDYKYKQIIHHNCNEVQFVDDNPNILNKYEKQMMKQNLPFVLFQNGMACHSYLKQLDCKLCKSGLIFTDLNMPQMDGHKLAQNIRNLNRPRIYKIVLISAEEQENIDNVFDQVFQKPFLPKKILEIYNETYGI